VAIFTSFDGYFVMMISPVFAPIVVAWASRTREKYADRVTADLGYGVPLREIFTGREVARAESHQRIDRTRLTASQPIESARLCALEHHLRSMAQNGHQAP
jgi:Zn-dependent protease with chaperone function